MLQLSLPPPPEVCSSLVFYFDCFFEPIQPKGGPSLICFSKEVAAKGAATMDSPVAAETKPVAGTLVLSTSPLKQPTHWKQTVLHLLVGESKISHCSGGSRSVNGAETEAPPGSNIFLACARACVYVPVLACMCLYMRVCVYMCVCGVGTSQDGEGKAWSLSATPGYRTCAGLLLVAAITETFLAIALAAFTGACSFQVPPFVLACILCAATLRGHMSINPDPNPSSRRSIVITLELERQGKETLVRSYPMQ